jgi:Ca2+-binding RTX toxin-like protein
MFLHRIASNWFARNRSLKNESIANVAKGNRAAAVARAASNALEQLESRRLYSVSAVSAGGTLVVTGDNTANDITVSRDAVGHLLVNSGAVPITGDAATVSNTSLITVLGGNGRDNLLLDESNGVLPKANLVGGNGDDTLAGGSGADALSGGNGDDVILGKAGDDQLFGGSGNDTLIGGVGTDQAFGQSGDDRMIWNPGEGSDLNEGGSGYDTVEVNGGNGSEVFTVTANGDRVRFDRTTPGPFSIDIGSSEKLVLNAFGGDDTFTAGTGLASLISITVDGGAGNDTLTGGDGNDTLIGGDGNDSLFGGSGDDVLIGGAGTDLLDGGAGHNVVIQ